MNQVHDLSVAIMDPAPGGGVHDGGNIQGANFETLGGQIPEKIKQGGSPVIIENRDWTSTEGNKPPTRTRRSEPAESASPGRRGEGTATPRL